MNGRFTLCATLCDVTNAAYVSITATRELGTYLHQQVLLHPSLAGVDVFGQLSPARCTGSRAVPRARTQHIYAVVNGGNLSLLAVYEVAYKLTASLYNYTMCQKKYHYFVLL